ncbi:hypothetical protein CU044_2854 [Streptomyces sp. L-9-10]|nr:hypothetical protein CU044_2854 [Streptomyces sp. L-9-10]
MNGSVGTALCAAATAVAHSASRTVERPTPRAVGRVRGDGLSVRCGEGMIAPHHYSFSAPSAQHERYQ